MLFVPHLLGENAEILLTLHGMELIYLHSRNIQAIQVAEAMEQSTIEKMLGIEDEVSHSIKHIEEIKLFLSKIQFELSSGR